jgi:hypothetical protein
VQNPKLGIPSKDQNAVASVKQINVPLTIDGHESNPGLKSRGRCLNVHQQLRFPLFSCSKLRRIEVDVALARADIPSDRVANDVVGSVRLEIWCQQPDLSRVFRFSTSHTICGGIMTPRCSKTPISVWAYRTLLGACFELRTCSAWTSPGISRPAAAARRHPHHEGSEAPRELNPRARMCCARRSSFHGSCDATGAKPRQTRRKPL